VPAYGPQNDVTLKMPAFEWVHVQLHQQKGMISLSPPTICNSAAPSAKGDDKFITTDYLQQCRAAQVNPGGFTTPARRPSVPHRTAGCGKSSLRPLMAGSSPSLP
ncbi:hypothetical protein FJV67_24600, partial [Salmonella enterica subsp. enterica serovar Typhimurium]|uniref:hypothetical protein n=1 Tax=Salmonella enterica TaxID=28901 RepID=UPI001167EA5A